ncbi:MAG: Lrp/AsnC family transcriptional regulator [Promethearchaeota archaeon]
MATCFVLINIQAGFVESVTHNIDKIEEVVEYYTVTGGVDMIVKVEGPDVETIAKTILAKIHSIEGISRTQTHIVVPL